MHIALGMKAANIGSILSLEKSFISYLRRSSVVVHQVFIRCILACFGGAAVSEDHKDSHHHFEMSCRSQLSRDSMFMVG